MERFGVVIVRDERLPCDGESYSEWVVLSASEPISVYSPGVDIMRQLLWWLIGGSRGGENRLRIVRTLHERPMNTNQLSETLDLNYKTVQHHLEVLEENDIVTTEGDTYGKMYFLTDRMTQNLDILADVAEQADLDTDGD